MPRPKRSGSRRGAEGSEKSSDLHGGDGDGFLAGIDRLLHIVAELMEKEPAIERQAFEHLRQLRVRIRFAMQAPQADPVQAILAAHPPKFTERDNKKESVVDFLRREYSRWFGSGISRADLKIIDKGLYDALNNWLSRHGQLPPDVDIPGKHELLERKLLAAGDIKAPSRSRRVSELSHSEREQLRLYEVARRRKKSDHGR